MQWWEKNIPHAHLDIYGTVEKPLKPKILLPQFRSVMDTRTRNDNLLPRRMQSGKTAVQVPFLQLHLYFAVTEFRPAGSKAHNKDAEIWKSHCFLVGNVTQKVMKNQNQKAEDEAILQGA